MSLFKALITDLTASKSKKVSVHIQELAAETITTIHAVEQQFQPNASEIAASCRKLVITLPRGQAGYDQAYKLYFDLKQERSPLHAAAWLASRLILADHVVARAGSHGLPSITGIALIQGYIHSFFQRHGVPEWKSPYYEHSFAQSHSGEGHAAEG